MLDLLTVWNVQNAFQRIERRLRIALIVNQVLLLIGNRRSEKAPDESHPFGYDGEMYFWAFVVAVIVLLAGGAASIYQGVHELEHLHAIDSPVLSLIVLALSAVFEGGSLVVGYRASRRVIARHPGDGKPVSMWRFIKLSKDPNMYESLLEDSAALIGIGIAAIGVIGSASVNRAWEKSSSVPMSSSMRRVARSTCSRLWLAASGR